MKTMGLWTWIRRASDAKIVEQQVETLVARQVNRIREAVEPRTFTLSQAEARGYIRAKAVRLLADALVTRTETEVPARLAAQILGTAAERVTGVLLERRHRVAAPTRLRRAA
jgi:hypothetical protein